MSSTPLASAPSTPRVLPPERFQSHGAPVDPASLRIWFETYEAWALLDLTDDKSGNKLWVSQLGGFLETDSEVHRAWRDYNVLHRHDPHARSWEACKQHIISMVCPITSARVAREALQHFHRGQNETLQSMLMRFRGLALAAHPMESWPQLDVSLYPKFRALVNCTDMNLHADLMGCASVSEFVARMAPLEAAQHYTQPLRGPRSIYSHNRGGNTSGKGSPAQSRRPSPSAQGPRKPIPPPPDPPSTTHTQDTHSQPNSGPRARGFSGKGPRDGRPPRPGDRENEPMATARSAATHTADAQEEEPDAPSTSGVLDVLQPSSKPRKSGRRRRPHTPIRGLVGPATQDILTIEGVMYTHLVDTGARVTIIPRAIVDEATAHVSKLKIKQRTFRPNKRIMGAGGPVNPASIKQGIILEFQHPKVPAVIPVPCFIQDGPASFEHVVLGTNALALLGYSLKTPGGQELLVPVNRPT